MGTVLDGIDQDLAERLHAAKVFFVATAPSGSAGHVNVSPKGFDSFRVLGPHRVAFADMTGSGIETIAHVRDNGRITFMFCAFDGDPSIIRLQGAASVHLPDDDGFAELADRFPPVPGLRSIITADLDRVSDSCGFGVPFMSYEGMRGDLIDWADEQGDDGLAQYRVRKNGTSIDGLPGYPMNRAAR
ncbi:MAG: pyridoxamine 5'-phosphate oxidase family protein [Acidimicrobiales bacterium]